MKYNHEKAQKIYNELDKTKKIHIYNSVLELMKNCITLPGLIVEIGKDISEKTNDEQLKNYIVIAAEAIYLALQDQEVRGKLGEDFAVNDQSFGMILGNLFYPLDNSQSDVMGKVEALYNDDN